MNLAQEMAILSTTVTNRESLDIIFTDHVLPKIRKATELKQREVAFNSFNERDEDKEVQKLFPKVSNLQSLVGGEMKPYLEDKGFKLTICKPAYYTYVGW
jgi:hypothetical protein